MLRASTRIPTFALVALLALSAVFLRRGLTGNPDAVLGRVDWDMDVLFYPQKAFAVESIRSGDFPLWNPYLFGGMPLHATLHPGLLYPPNLLFLALPPALAFNALFALHLALAGAFTYALLRDLRAGPWPALFGAIAFAFSSRFLLHVHVGHFPQVEALAWTPGLFYFAVRLVRRPSARRAAALSVALACALLAGFPQYPVYAVVALASGLAAHTLLAPRRRAPTLALAAAALAGGVLLAAAQILPGLAYALESFRSQAPLKFASNGFLPVENLATFLFPSALGDSVHAWYFGKWSHAQMIYYAGIATVAFAALGIAARESRRRCLPWFLLFVGAVVIALGVQTPAFHLMRLLPIVQNFRGIGKFTAVGLLGLAVCAGLALDSFVGRLTTPGASPSPANAPSGATTMASRMRLRFGRARPLLAVLAVFAALGLALLLAIEGDGGTKRLATFFDAVARGAVEPLRKPPPEMGRFLRDLQSALATNAARVIACAGLLSVAALLTARTFAPIATILLALDLFTAFDPFIRPISVARDIEPSPEVSRALGEVPPLARFGGTRDWMMQGISRNASAIGGWEGNLPLRTLAFMNFLAGFPPGSPALYFEPSKPSLLLDLLVMQRLLRPDAIPVDSSRFRIIEEREGLVVYERTSTLPRAYVVHQVECEPAPPSSWDAIVDGRIDPYRVATVECEADARLPNAGAAASVMTAPADAACVRLDGPDRVVVDVETASPGLLVLLDPYDDGWKATVGRRAAPVVPVFGFFRGVYVDAGRHEVVFSYAPESMAYGLAISAAAALAVIVIWIGPWDRDPKRSDRSA